jgi:hypothetical protein
MVEAARLAGTGVRMVRRGRELIDDKERSDRIYVMIRLNLLTESSTRRFISSRNSS